MVLPRSGRDRYRRRRHRLARKRRVGRRVVHQPDDGRRDVNFNAAGNGGVGSALCVEGGSGAATGQFDPFLTLQSNTDTEKGYNTQPKPNCEFEVTDTLQGTLGTVCFGVDTLPKTFSNVRPYGPFGAGCSDHVIPNTASFETTDQLVTGSSAWTLTITVPCPTGCTLTQGYWKTHSIYGPAKKADATWTSPSGSTWDTGFNQDSVFYNSGQTYYQVMWTSPKGGNGYYILAHQYIAALLNIHAGAATTPAVVGALTYAETFFTTYIPTSTFSKTVKAAAIGAAGTLGSYNEGLIGPGHCSEDTTGTSADN